MNPLDRVISWLSPRTALQRARARVAVQALLSYEGANVGRRTSGWAANATSANAEVGGGLTKLRDRSRDLVRNSPYAERAISEIVQQSIGTGIAAQAQGDSDGVNRIIDGAWEQWGAECDPDGQLDWCGIQELVLRTMLESGECLIRYRPRFADDGLLVPLQLQVLEPDHLDHNKMLSMDSKDGRGSVIVQGVEFDQIGRRVAYWIFPNHPGDVMYTSRGSMVSRRVPASEILHVYRKKRPGQVRGVPLLAPVIIALRDLDEYQDAERVRKKIEACLAAFVEQPEGPDGPSLGAITGTDDASAQRIEEFRPGMVMYGKPGEKAQFFAPTGAGGYSEYVKQNERMIATGVGVTYEQLTGDLSNVNYSSYRAGLMSFRAGMESLRWMCIIPGFLRPVRQRFINAAYAAGAIPIQEYRTTWTPPGFGSVDPGKDAAAMEIDLRTGRMTWPQAVAEYGFDPIKQIEEIEKWKQRLEAAGVQFQPQGGGNSNNENPNPAN